MQAPIDYTAIPCQHCDGSGVDPVNRPAECHWCDGSGESRRWSCGCCCEEWEEPISHGYNTGHRSVHRVDYMIGDRRYTFCDTCAPLAADEDGSAKRGMLAELDDLIEWLRVAREPDEIGAARGFAMALRMRLADLTRWSGHNREMVEWVKTEREAYRERARRYAR